jgi:hypothetical protein
MSDNGDRTMKKIILAAAFVLTATSAAFAQYFAPGYYDAAPGYYGYYGAPGYYGYYGSPPAWYENDVRRGGPGPRVGSGSGMGVGAQR